MSDAAGLLIELNAALAAAVLAVMLVRRRFRETFGPRAAYGLWAAVPTAMAAVCAPRVGDVEASVGAESAVAVGLLIVWLCGVVVSAGLVVAAQARFAHQARQGLAGPAVTGLIVGRLVMPADSATRWNAEELAVIRDHERTHLARGDLRVNAAVTVLRCLFWCNPLAYLGADRFRFDQELACDATVMAQRPGRRRLYAEALLKVAPTTPPVLGCGWGSSDVRMLETRMASLRLRSHRGGLVSTLLVLAFVAVGATSAWWLQPASPKPLASIPPTVLKLRLQPPVVLPTP